MTTGYMSSYLSVYAKYIKYVQVRLKHYYTILYWYLSVKDIGQNMHVDVSLFHGHRKLDSTLKIKYSKTCLIWRVWRYQRGNQNPYIEEEQTTQWPREKVQKDKQRSTKHTYKTKDRVTRTQLKTGGELRCSGRVSSSCSTSGTRRANLVTNPVISNCDISILPLVDSGL